MLPFTLPLLGRPILWYGFLFALGFFISYFIFPYFLRRDFLENPHLAVFRDSYQTVTKKLTERGVMAVGLGAIIGARLGDVLFYQSTSAWLHNPLSILYVWEGGLASHGAVIGILLALAILARRLRNEGLGFFNLLRLADRIAPFVALAGCFIRIGNFINQEILGKPTDMPWAVLFLHPADGSAVVPRHPVQLYESIAYLVIFIGLYTRWSRQPLFRSEGKCLGLFFTLIFGVRFLAEFFKVEQSTYSTLPFMLTMGQLLSIPLVILGFWLTFRKPREIPSSV